MTVQCLRCTSEIGQYFYTPLTLVPYGNDHPLAILECSKCGHVEFLSTASPLLKDLEGVSVYAGDGD